MSRDHFNGGWARTSTGERTVMANRNDRAAMADATLLFAGLKLSFALTGQRSHGKIRLARPGSADKTPCQLPPHRRPEDQLS